MLVLARDQSFLHLAASNKEMSASVAPSTAEPMTTDVQDTVVVGSRPVDQGLFLEHSDSLNSDVVKSISDFLAKPRRVANVTFSTTSASNAVLASGNSFDFSTDPFFLQKLSGFQGIRYTTNIKVLCTATPFQQGKLRLNYYPNALESNKFVMHGTNLVSRSQLPGVEFTMSEGGCEVSIPFLSFMQYYDLISGRGDPVSWNLSVFSPLLVGTAAFTSVPVSIWIWFTDVELFGATTVEPQSSMVKKVKVRTVSAQEDKPLSNWLSASSVLASSMSSIPVISSITGPSAYWLKRASNLANAFGFSRPINGEPVRPMAPHYHSSLPNSDGINVSSVLAVNHDVPSRLIDDYSPMGMDEMSVNFIKKQWSYCAEFSFNTLTPLGAQIFSAPLRPIDDSLSSSFGRTPTPVGFLGYLMRYYRGGFELDFRFIKTGFHAGSIAISYATGDSPATITESQSDLLHRTIVDIQKGDSLCLSFPYVNHLAWRQNFQSYGRVYAHVVNALTAPETVANSITVQVYIRGMDDLEFSGICDADQLYPLVETPLIEPQGVVNDETGEIVCSPVGAALRAPKLSGLQSMDCMSESVTSLLQLCKIGARCQFPFSGTTDDPVTFSFNPSAWCVRGLSLPSTFSDPPYVNTIMNAIRSCFAFQRGGYEINVIPTSTAQRNAVTATLVQSPVGPVFTPTFKPILGCRFEVTNPNRYCLTQNFASNNSRYGLSISVPYKSYTRVNPIVPYVATGTVGYNTVSQQRNAVVISCQTSDTILLRGAEDFQLLYWVGVPTLAA